MDNIEEKQTLLRTEIINKGYDGDDFLDYLSNLKEGEIDLKNWNINELTIAVKKYQKKIDDKKENENKPEISLIDIEINGNEQKTKNEEKKEKEKIRENINGFEIINYNEISNNTQEINNAQLLNSNLSISMDLSKNPLTEFYLNIPCNSFVPSDIANMDDLNITISNPSLVKGGFLKSVYKYTLTTIGFNFKVERTLSDFDWLYNQLLKFYPGLIISSIPVKHFNLKDNSKKKITYIEYYINSLSHYKPIRSSQIFQDFITIPYEQFKNKKKVYEEKKMPSSFRSFTNLNGEIKIFINEERDYQVLRIKDDISKKVIGYNKLTYAFNNIISSFENCKKAMNDLVDSFNDLKNLYCKEVNFSKKMNFLKQTFEQWSKSYEDQTSFFIYDLKYFFKFFEKELNESLNLYNEYKSSKDIYLREFESLKKNNKNDKEHLEMLNNLRKHYGYYLNCFIEEYDNLIQRHDQRMIFQFKKYRENINIYVQEYQNLIKFINVSFD